MWSMTTDSPPGILVQLAAVTQDARDYLRQTHTEEELVHLIFRWFIQGIIRGQESIEEHLNRDTERNARGPQA
jgi:hypothetical protein